ncbi:DUF3369 domain-containing protein [bacterium]|nr:DUF3369 domain-containing protein [bacterium]
MHYQELNNQELNVIEKSERFTKEFKKAPWKVIIADDEPEIHSVTRLVLDNFEFDGRKLVFLSTYSGAETMDVIRENPDTALLLLDVVMESEDAGLKVVRYIREELENPFVRIVLRTGQPGQAPAKKIVSTYDINDYKEKTELTSERLFTTIMASLRAFRDLQMIDRNRRSLERIVAVSPIILRYKSFNQLAAEILLQISALLHMDSGNHHGKEDSLFVIWNREPPFCLAGTGRFSNARMQPLSKAVPLNIQQLVIQKMKDNTNHFDEHLYCGTYQSSNKSRHAIFLDSSGIFERQHHEILQLFTTTAAAAIENIHLNKEIEATQMEVIATLGEMIECRFREMGKHVKRVSAYAYLLAVKAGLSEMEAETLKFASPMHDIGKIGIPDEILKKPSRLTDPEFEIMKTHTTIGYNLLKGSERQTLKCAAIIALQHHERWDGKGYPNGLSGDGIEIIGRITRLVDVFDALSNRRIYKPAWEVDVILKYLRDESGTQFDPRLVDLFMVNINEFLEIKDLYPNEAK